MPDLTPPTPDRDAAAAALEAQADELLWGAAESPRYLAYSFYRETNLTRAIRNDPQNEGPPPDLRMLRETAGQLLEALLAEVVLEERYRRVLSLARQGLNGPQIATAMGIQHRTALRWYHTALHKLHDYCRRQARRDADVSVLQAYLEQLVVGVPRRETHCAPGREDCRRDGLCKHRWYLHHDETQE